MTPSDAIDLAREAIVMLLLLSAPVLIAGLVVGLLVGLLQALTQIQEQTVSFVPKLIAMVLALSVSLPWLVSRMMEYSQDLFAGIPDRL